MLPVIALQNLAILVVQIAIALMDGPTVPVGTVLCSFLCHCLSFCHRFLLDVCCMLPHVVVDERVQIGVAIVVFDQLVADMG